MVAVESKVLLYHASSKAKLLTLVAIWAFEIFDDLMVLEVIHVCQVMY